MVKSGKIHARQCRQKWRRNLKQRQHQNRRINVAVEVNVGAAEKENGAEFALNKLRPAFRTIFPKAARS